MFGGEKNLLPKNWEMSKKIMCWKSSFGFNFLLVLWLRNFFGVTLFVVIKIFAVGIGKFGIEDQVDLAGAERGNDLKIVGGDLQACDVKCWEVGWNNCTNFF